MEFSFEQKPGSFLSGLERKSELVPTDVPEALTPEEYRSFFDEYDVPVYEIQGGGYAKQIGEDEFQLLTDAGHLKAGDLVPNDWGLGAINRYAKNKDIEIG